MIETLNGIDTELYLFFNGLLHTPVLDTFMRIFTGRFVWVPFYVAIALMLVKTFRPRLAFIYIIAIGAAVALSDQTCATIIRPLVGRLRPSCTDNPLSELAIIVDGYRGGRYGFPSCHAANSFALAVFVSVLIRRRKVVLFVLSWAVLNSYSRLYLGVHYPGDLFVGAAIGSAFGAACCLLARRVMADHRRKSLQKIGTPLFSIPLRTQFYGFPQSGIGITVSDMMIGVGLFTILVIMTFSL